MRTFSVIVQIPRSRRWARYDPAPAEQALASAQELKSRGRSVRIETTANGITEYLTVAELREVIH